MKYRTIVADPPWPYPEEFVQIHSRAGRVTKPLPYSALKVDEIAALPISDLADTNCRLFCWATSRFLPDAFGVIRAWHFDYKQTIVWHKAGNPSPWGGSVAPNHAEFLLVAVRGAPGRGEMWKSSVISINVGEHSAKPDAFLDLVEQVSPGPYLELFARRARFGWDYWGDESLGTCDILAKA